MASWAALAADTLAAASARMAAGMPAGWAAADASRSHSSAVKGAAARSRKPVRLI
jgi:hypothetical protein